MEILANPITFAFGLAIMIFGNYSDAKSSMDFKYYGMDESNFARDANKDFDLTIYIGAFGAIALAMSLVVALGPPIGGAFATCTVTAIGGVAYLFSRLNETKKKKSRATQLRVLSERSWHGMLLITRNKKSFYGLFRFLDSDKQDLQEALDEINAKMSAFADNPVFPK